MISIRPERTSRGGEPRVCSVPETGPKTKNQFMVRERIWVDAADCAIARLEGRPAKTPASGIHSVPLVHRNDRIGEFWLPVSDRSRADARIFGRTGIGIEYFAYRISEDATGKAGLASGNRGPRHLAPDDVYRQKNRPVHLRAAGFAREREDENNGPCRKDRLPLAVGTGLFPLHCVVPRATKPADKVPACRLQSRSTSRRGNAMKNTRGGHFGQSAMLEPGGIHCAHTLEGIDAAPRGSCPTSPAISARIAVQRLRIRCAHLALMESVRTERRDPDVGAAELPRIGGCIRCAHLALMESVRTERRDPDVGAAELPRIGGCRCHLTLSAPVDGMSPDTDLWRSKST
jgi:hypothetical protein